MVLLQMYGMIIKTLPILEKCWKSSRIRENTLGRRLRLISKYGHHTVVSLVHLFLRQGIDHSTGTYTKKSVTVGPRTPFAQDPALDYTYDSGDDWQDDEGGEDVDDFGEGAAEPEDEGEDESEGEFDDWLDDSEDGGYVPAEGDEEIQPIPPSEEQSKLPMKVVKKRDVPRKVVKLTPVWRGPMWESKVGEGSDGMESYRLHLLNGKCAVLSIGQF